MSYDLENSTSYDWDEELEQKIVETMAETFNFTLGKSQGGYLTATCNQCGDKYTRYNRRYFNEILIHHYVYRHKEK